MESHDTQEASRGDEGQDRDLTPDGVGESKTRRGEDMGGGGGQGARALRQGHPGQTGTAGRGSTARDSTGVNP